MKSIELLYAVGEVKNEYIQDILTSELSESILSSGNSSHKTSQPPNSRHILLIAAIIALLLLLAGCVVYYYRLENLVVVDHTAETVSLTEAHVQNDSSKASAETTQETGPGPFVAEKVLSMQGYEGSPAYQALQDWLAYEVDYLIQNPECRFQNSYSRPEEYRDYICYSQEMTDKVDEICSQYGLQILGKGSFINDTAGMESNGLSCVLSPEIAPRCFYGYLYEDGSFVASGELELSGAYEKTIQFQMHSIRKDAFYPVPLGLNNTSGFTQWNYTTADGYQALMALNGTTGLIFVENQNRFISITIGEVPDANMVFTGLPSDKQFLKLVCDCFRFSDFWDNEEG